MRTGDNCGDNVTGDLFIEVGGAFLKFHLHACKSKIRIQKLNYFIYRNIDFFIKIIVFYLFFIFSNEQLILLTISFNDFN